MDIQQALSGIVEGEDLAADEMRQVMRQVMGGEATEAQIGALLVGLRMKGETIEEIAAAVEVMRELATPVQVEAPGLLDMAGTGGDGANLFNVSTAAALVVAAAGVKVAKHGNRGVSSRSGSSDLLEELGLPLDLDPGQIARCIEAVGIGFLFAPRHHSAMRHAVGPRRELALRTIFNMLGPMTNPAAVKRQVIGVFSAALAPKMAQVLQRLGSEHVLVVHGEDGLDEISLAGATRVVELKAGEISQYRITPEDFGLPRQSLDGLAVDSPAQSARLLRSALTGKADKAAQMIALNAGAGIYVGGVADSLEQGVKMAEDVLAIGSAAEKLSELVQFAQLARSSQ